MALAELHIVAVTLIKGERIKELDLRMAEDFDINKSPYPFTVNSDKVVCYWSTGPDSKTTTIILQEGVSIEVRERYEEVRLALLPPKGVAIP